MVSNLTSWQRMGANQSTGPGHYLRISPIRTEYMNSLLGKAKACMMRGKEQARSAEVSLQSTFPTMFALQVLTPLISMPMVSRGVYRRSDILRVAI